MLTMIYGRSGSGKSKKCAEIAHQLWQAGKPLYVIVPEQFTYTAERQIVQRMGITSPQTVEILSFKRFYHYCINIWGGTSNAPLSATGKLMLLRMICDEQAGALKMLGRAAAFPGFCQVLGSIISECKHYLVTPQKLRGAASALPEGSMLALKADNLATLYESYEKAIAETFADPDDFLTILAGLIRSSDRFFGEATFIFDEFSGFTPQEFQVIEALMEQKANMVFAFCTDNCLEAMDSSELFYIPKRTMQLLRQRAELEGIATDEIHLGELKKFENSPALLHIEKCLCEGINHPYLGPISHVSITACDQLQTEIHHVACKIIALVRDGSLRYRDIAITTREPARYGPIMQQIFAKYDIPLFMDNKSSAAMQPAAAAMLAAMDILLRNWSYESVFTYVKSGFAPIENEEADLIENHVLAAGISGSVWCTGEFTYIPFDISKESTEAYLTKINDIRKKIATPLSILFEALKKAENGEQMCRALYDFLIKTGVDTKIDQLSSEMEQTDSQGAARLQQVWDILMSTLEAAVSVAGRKKITPKQLRGLLKTGISSFEIGTIPVSVDAVSVGSVERSRSGKVAALFLIGVCDGAFPCVAKNEGLLSDSDRNTLKSLEIALAPDTRGQAFAEQYMIYQAITTPTDQLYLSYSATGPGGEALGPSIYIYKIKKMLPQLQVQDLVMPQSHHGMDFVASPKAAMERTIAAIGGAASGEVLQDIYQETDKWFLDSPRWNKPYQNIKKLISYQPSAAPLSEETKKQIYPQDTIYTSVSQIETFRKCPFAYYAKYHLHARPRKKAALAADGIGLFMHKIVECVSLCVSDYPGGWANTTKEEILAIASKEADRLIEQAQQAFYTPLASRNFRFAQLKTAAMHSVAMLWSHLKRSEFIPMGYEITFKEGGKYTPVTIDMGEGKKMKLQGVIDRADTLEMPDGSAFIRVIDYKTGNKSFHMSDVYHGFDMQLCIYMDKLCEQMGAEPAGMLYFRLYDPAASLPPDSSEDLISATLQKEYKMRGLVLADRKVTEKMDTAIGESGKSDIIPTAPSSMAGYEQMKAMRRHIKKLATTLCREIMAGKTDISPTKYRSTTACDYCDYSDMCHFDVTCGCKYRTLPILKPQDAWDEIITQGLPKKEVKST